MNSIYYAYLTALFLILLGYVAGYVIGRLDLIYRTLRLATSFMPDATNRRVGQAPKGPQNAAVSRVEIDERKFVVPVATDNLKKTAETSIGKITTTTDDIQASVSKLAQLKGK